MAKVLAIAVAALLAAAGEESVELKVTVDGMSCPTGCAPKVAKALSAVAGAKDVKLEDFEKGTFSLALDAKAELKADAFQKALGDYKMKKLEATVVGTISQKDKELTLTTAGGRKIGIDLPCCADEKAADAKKVDGDLCPAAAAAIKAKVESAAKDGRVVKVTGVVGSCCQLSLAITAIDEVKKATN